MYRLLHGEFRGELTVDLEFNGEGRFQYCRSDS